MKSLKIALIGECMIELQEIASGETKQTFGGDTLNTAIYCARLARDLPLQIDYVTALGQDSFSDKMTSFWELEGVGSELVLRQEGELPGLYYIELDDQGERIFHYWRSAAAAKKCFEYHDSGVILEKLADYDGIYLSGISLAILTPQSLAILIQRLSELAARGVSIYFDCNYRPHLWTSKEQAIAIYKQLYGLSDIVFLTTEEADILLECVQGHEVHQKLQSFGAKESILKDGENPCTIFSENEIFEVPAQEVAKVVDTTAAGDSFSAVYLVARRFGCAPVDAARMAHQTAAYVVCHRGAVAPLEQMPVTGLDILASGQL
jgi:2-dehydro-3-deoxygluconokinase